MWVGFELTRSGRLLAAVSLAAVIAGCSSSASLEPVTPPADTPSVTQPSASEPETAATGLPQVDDDAFEPVNDPAAAEPDAALAQTEPPAETLEQDEFTIETPAEPEVTEPVVWSTPINGPHQLEDITDLVLLTGQSNALGAGTSFDAGLDSPDSRVLAYTDRGWQIADLHQIWDLGWHPGNDGSEPPSNNLALHYGKRMVQLTAGTNRVFGFVLATAPGQPIAHWQRDGDFYRAVDRKVRAALAEHPTKNQLDGILWHQGESDANGGEAYAQALNSLVANFRAESWFSADRPFICGETSQFAVNAQLMALNHDGDPWTGCIAAAGLPTHEDGAHFLATALRTMGQRYADLYNQMWWQLPR